MNASVGNVTLSQESLFRILLVEDELDVLNDLRLIIGSTLPRSEIHAAASVEAAKAYLASSLHRRLQYHLALLDFKLPPGPGMQEEFDFSVCESVRKMDIPVVHFSAYGADEEIQRHMNEFHRKESLVDVPAVVIEKTASADWSKTLMGHVGQYYQRTVSKGIFARLSELFPFSETGPTGSALRASGASRSATHALYALEKDIVEVWSFLEPEVRARVRSVFATVEPADKPKRLSLF